MIPKIPDEWRPRFWIFQSTPDRYDLLEGNRLEPGFVTSWQVSRFKQEIRAGDYVFLWRAKGKVKARDEAAPERGIWGWGLVIRDAAGAERVPVQVVKRFARPVEAKRLSASSGLRKLSILKSPQGTNFAVTDAEVSLLAPLIELVGGEPPPRPLLLQPPVSISSRRALDGARQIADAMGDTVVHLAQLVMGLASNPQSDLARDLKSISGREGRRADYLGQLWRALGNDPDRLPALDYASYDTVDFIPRLSAHTLRVLLEADEIRRAEQRDWVEHGDLVAGMRAVPDAAAAVALDRFLSPGSHVVDERKTPAAEDPNVSTFLADAATGQDKLGVEVDAKAMAALIASQNLAPPLAIGLFGGWGSGKSFFMSLVQRHVERFCNAARAATVAGRPTAFCQRDLHIRFNAWHYADANLWASLVNGILDGVANHLQLSMTPAQRRDQLVKQLKTYGELIREAEEEEAAAASALEKAREEHERARVQEQLASTLMQVAERLGLSTEKELAQLQVDLRKRLSAPGRLIRHLRRVFIRPKGLLFLVLVAVTSAAFTDQGIALVQSVLPAASKGLAALPTGLLALLQAPSIRAAWTALGRASDLVDEAERVEAEAVEVDPAGDADEQLEPYKQRSSAASMRRQELESRRRSLALEIASLAPQRQLRELIQSRTASDSPYRQSEGLIAQIRRDFGALADHIQSIEAAEAKKARPEAGAGPPPPDRIVLYIDDLDRCEPRRVVEVLQAVHLLLAFDLFVVVVAVDPRWLLSALKSHYPDMLLDPDRQRMRAAQEEEVEGESSSQSGDSSDDRFGGTYMATPRDYLEKIFQIPYSVPAMRPKASKEYMRDLVERTEPTRAESPPSSHHEHEQGPGVETTQATDQPQVEAADAGSDEAEPKRSIVERAAAWLRDLGILPTRREQPEEAEPASPEPEPEVAEEGEATGVAAAVDEQGGEEAEGLDANPKSLELSPHEREHIEALGPLFRSPRSSKRFVNVYRLLRATIPDSEIEAFAASPGGAHREVAMLLAAVLECPDLAPEILELVERTAAADEAAEWLQVVQSKALESQAQSRLLGEDLERLREFSEVDPSMQALSLSAMSEWLNRVERFTFAY
ncbi:MAG: P-loop NTPase fold protein [Myxococcota bacterium]|nr:P-loop NTPase fold protein [Myxococcota bacterium]